MVTETQPDPAAPLGEVVDLRKERYEDHLHRPGDVGQVYERIFCQRPLARCPGSVIGYTVVSNNEQSGSYGSETVFELRMSTLFATGWKLHGDPLPFGKHGGLQQALVFFDDETLSDIDVHRALAARAWFP